MKRIITIVIGFLFLQATSGPKHDVCGPYDPNRTLEQFKRAVLDTTNTFMVTQLWPAYVSEINLIMKESKDSNVRRMVFKPKFKDMQFILHYSKDVHYSLIGWQNYINSHKESNKLVFQDEQGNISNGVFFEYKDVSDLYSKIACFNAAKKKRKKEVIPVVPEEEKKITPDPVLASNCCTTLIYIDNSISNSFNTNTTTENSNNTTTSTTSSTTSSTASTSTSTPVAQKLGTDYRSSNLGTDYRSAPTYYSSTYNQPAPIVYSRDPGYYTAPAPVPLPVSPQPRPVPREPPPHASGPVGRTTPDNNAGGAGGRDASGNGSGNAGRGGNNTGSGMKGRGG